MNLFESGEAYERHLELAFNYLMTTLPTSIGAERAFSSAINTENKLRSRFGDETLDVVLFL